MSVKACSRNGCDAIMCDNLVLHSTAYLCVECLSELKMWRKTWPETTTVAAVADKIRTFIDSPKSSLLQELDPVKVESEFLSLIGERDDQTPIW